MLIRVSSCVETQIGGGSAFNGAFLLMVDQPLVIKNKKQTKISVRWNKTAITLTLMHFLLSRGTEQINTHQNPRTSYTLCCFFGI